MFLFTGCVKGNGGNSQECVSLSCWFSWVVGRVWSGGGGGGGQCPHWNRSTVRLFIWMTLNYPSPMWPGHSGCTRLRQVCTLTPTEVWSASWSKGTRQNHDTHTHTHLQLTGHSSQTHTPCWQALTWIPGHVPGGDQWKCRGASVTGDPVHWGVFSSSARPAFWRVWRF